MLAQPPDSYRGPFPLLDPRFPIISQAHESAEEAWNRAAGTKNLQHQAMMQHALRQAPLQQIHAERLGLEGGPDGGMQDRAPMTLASEYHTASERQSTVADDDDGAWWDTPEYNHYVRRSPFTNATQTGLVQHMETQTEHYGSRQRREQGTEQSEGGSGEEGGGGGQEEEREERPSLRHYASAGWNHARPLAELGGAALGATAIGGGYALGALGSLGYHGVRGAANLMGNFLHSEPGDEEEQPRPPAPPPPQLPQRTAQNLREEPEVPVPPYLLDHEERMRAARQGPNLGTFASREYDRQRLAGYEREDRRRRAYGV